MAFYLQSSFVPRYSIFEIQNVEQGADPIKISVNLMLRINKIVDAVNSRRVGIYDLDESPSGETYPPVQSGTISAARPVYWKTFFAGPLLNAGALVIPHGINWTANTTLISLTISATDTANLYGIEIPHVDVSGTPVVGNIEKYIDATNIVITSSGDASAFNKVDINVRWLQD